MKGRVILALLIGAALGWGARVHTSGDQLILAVAERYLAERNYYNRQSDAILKAEAPKKEMRRGQKKD